MAGAEPSKRLTRDQCLAKAEECRELSRVASNLEHRTMLTHMAETWQRMADAVPSKH